MIEQGLWVYTFSLNVPFETHLLKKPAYVADQPEPPPDLFFLSPSLMLLH